MTDSDLRHEAEDIHDQLPDSVNVSPADLQERLTTLVTEYRIPLDEARRSVINTHLETTDTDQVDIDRDNQLVDLADIDEDEQWVDLRVTLVELWEPRSDSIAQVGLLGDESGTIKFVAFETSDLPELTEGQSYQLTNVVTDEYEGNYSVKLNRTTEITEIDADIEIGDNAETLSGALVDIQSGSGLIKRCPIDGCTRVLQNGRCPEHGDVDDGEFDLRIKGVIDNGDTVQEVIFDREMTEQAAGISLEQAQQMAMDALDTSVVADKVREVTLGRYYRVEGPVMGRYLLVNEFEQITTHHDPDDILVEARSI